MAKVAISRTTRSLVALIAALATGVAVAAPAAADDPTPPAPTPQTITFPTPDTAKVGDPNVQLTATSDSGLPVTYTIDGATGSFNNEADCDLDETGTAVIIVHAGVCVVDADQAGTVGSGDPTEYAPADEVTRAFVIRKAAQSIDFTMATSTSAVGAPSDGLNATATSGLASITFTVDPSSVTTGDDPVPVCQLNQAGDRIEYLHVGRCTIDADQPGNNDYNAAATTSQFVDISQGTQAITLGSLPAGAVGDTNTLDPTTTAAATAPDLAVALTIDASTTNQACTVDPATNLLTYQHAGNCVVDANQAGNDDYAAATQVVSNTLTVAKAAQAVSLPGAPASAPIGTTYQPTTQGGASNNTVTLTVPSPSACTINSTTNKVTFTHAGTCTIDASQSGNADYESGAHDQAISVSKASTTSAISLHQAANATEPTITVAVSALSPAVVPSVNDGQVTITVDGKPAGTPSVSNGVATLAYPMKTGVSHVVKATYTGADDFTSAPFVSANRTDPKIVASLTSAQPKSRYGWYRTPVTTSFTCAIGTAAFGACPAKATLSANGKSQAVSRTITASDGGAATAGESGINIDTVKPTVQVAGVSNGNSYLGNAPSARCLGTDRLSGLASCKLTRVQRANGVTAYTATATDKAGNTATTTGTYRVVRNYVLEAIYDASSGSYLVHTATPYTLVALANSQPRYYGPVVFGHQPKTAGAKLTRHGSEAHLKRWQLTVSFRKSLKTHRYWSIGLRIHGVMNLIKLRIVR